MARYDQNLPANRGREGQGISRYDQGGYLAPFFPSFFDTSPFQMMRRMQEDMDRIFSPFVVGNFGTAPSLVEAAQRFQPSVDISENEKEFMIDVDLPGVRPEDVDVQVHDNHLILRSTLRQESGQEPQMAGGGQPAITGQETDQRQYHRRERRFGYFERVFPLPQNVDQQNIRCDFKDGVLTCHLPKTGEIEPPQGRRIAINTTGGATAGSTGAAGQSSMAAGQSVSTPPQTGGAAGEAGKETATAQGAGSNRG
jgi:HSP20 family protein